MQAVLTVSETLLGFQECPMALRIFERRSFHFLVAVEHYNKGKATTSLCRYLATCLVSNTITPYNWPFSSWRTSAAPSSIAHLILSKSFGDLAAVLVRATIDCFQQLEKLNNALTQRAQSFPASRLLPVRQTRARPLNSRSLLETSDYWAFQ